MICEDSNQQGAREGKSRLLNLDIQIAEAEFRHNWFTPTITSHQPHMQQNYARVKITRLWNVFLLFWSKAIKVNAVMPNFAMDMTWKGPFLLSHSEKQQEQLILDTG